MRGFLPGHSEPAFRNMLGLPSRIRTDKVGASTLVEDARQSGEVFPAAPVFAPACRPRPAAKSAKGSGSGCRHDISDDPEPRSHRCSGDVVVPGMEQRG